MKERVLTGIKPTGYAHLGNYFGAIKPAIEMSKDEGIDCLYFIADYHALTTVKTREEMEEYTYNIACTWLACGLDPSKVIFYKQSDIPEDLELGWILCNLTPKGLMNRAHAYKACVEKNEAAGVDRDAGVNMGLYNYPVLMAADILLFNSKRIPVGLDQTQHVEIARDIAIYFNNRYGNIFTLPESFVEKETSILVGLDGRKMSKSYGNTIQLFTDEKTLQKSVNRIVTDSRLPGEAKDTDNTICKLYRLFASPNEVQDFERRMLEGLGWGDAKKELFAKMNQTISPMREKFDYYQSHRDEVDAILEEGAKKARAIATPMLAKIKKAIGITR